MESALVERFFKTNSATKHDYVKLIHSNVEHEKYLVVNMCLGNTCNYSCTYCPQSLHDGSTPWYDLGALTAFTEKVIEHYRDKKIYFELTGGEVTLWRDLPRYAQYLKERNIKLGIISNGSRSLDWWQGFSKYLDHVCLSFHPQSAKKEHFTKIVNFMSQNIRTHVNIMMDPSLFDYALDAANEVKNIPNISIALQPLIHDFGDQLFDYSDAQKEILENQNKYITKYIHHDKIFESFRGAMSMVSVDGQKKSVSPDSFISNGENNWFGWSCFVGNEQIVVNMGGEIYRGWCSVGGRIGHVKDSKIAFPEKPVICNKKMCHCNFDIMATKVSPDLL